MRLGSSLRVRLLGHRRFAASANAAPVVSQIKGLFAKGGDSTYDPTSPVHEIVTQRQHALQVASLARDRKEAKTLVVAALLHDVGHLLVDEELAVEDGKLVKDLGHEEVSANFLASRNFPPSVTEPVRLHVPAKRYLCFSTPGYWESLSDASKQSLEVQGGVFNAQEAEEFIKRPYAPDAVRLREYDDLGKLQDIATESLDAFLDDFVAPLLDEQ